MGLDVVFVIALWEIALIGRKDALSRELAIAGDGAHFATADDIVKFLEMGLIGVIVRVEIEVLPLVAASIAKRVGRWCGWVAAEDSGWVIEDWAGASHRYDKRKRDDFQQRHCWRRQFIASRVLRWNCEESEMNASVDLKVAIDLLFIIFLSRGSSQQQGRDENPILVFHCLDCRLAEARRMAKQPILRVRAS